MNKKSLKLGVKQEEPAPARALPAFAHNFKSPYLTSMAGWLDLVSVNQQRNHELIMEYMDRVDRNTDKLREYYG